MPFQPVPFGLKVAMEFNKNSQLVVNVYHVITNDPIVTANLTAIGNVFLNWWTNHLRQTQSVALALQQIVVTALNEQEGIQVTIPGSGLAGTQAGADAPNNVAIVASHRTAQIGRTRRGRTYLAGIVAADVQADTVPSARATAIAIAYSTLRSAINAENAYLAVVSYQFNNVPRPAGIATAITTTLVDTRVDTQRRRLAGDGA